MLSSPSRDRRAVPLPEDGDEAIGRVEQTLGVVT